MEKWSAPQRRAFGERLAQARRAKHLTLDAVGAELEVLKQSVSHWEHGRNLPSAEVLALLCRLYGVSSDWLLSGDGAPNLMNEPSTQSLTSSLSSAIGRLIRARLSRAFLHPPPRF